MKTNPIPLAKHQLWRHFNTRNEAEGCVPWVVYQCVVPSSLWKSLARRGSQWEQLYDRKGIDWQLVHAWVKFYRLRATDWADFQTSFHGWTWDAPIEAACCNATERFSPVVICLDVIFDQNKTADNIATSHDPPVQSRTENSGIPSDPVSREQDGKSRVTNRSNLTINVIDMSCRFVTRVRPTGPPRAVPGGARFESNPDVHNGRIFFFPFFFLLSLLLNPFNNLDGIPLSDRFIPHEGGRCLAHVQRYKSAHWEIDTIAAAFYKPTTIDPSCLVHSGFLVLRGIKSKCH